MRARYPQAIAMRAPLAVLDQASAGIPAVRAAATGLPASTHDPSLTDTQVMQVLEARRITSAVTKHDVENTGIRLLRPDDTDVRRALKEAVLQRAPVSFAIQLRWSAEPIESHREGRSWFSLRLGFFSEALSARQVAHYVRSSFEAVAVVPVAEQERLHAKRSPIHHSALARSLP